MTGGEAELIANLVAAALGYRRIFGLEDQWRKKTLCRYGAPETLHSDQGRNFESELVKEVCQLFGVTKTRATAYHPQSDGLVERMNRTLLDMLAKASIDHPEDWDVYLDRVLLAYRTSVHCTTGATPSRVVFGRELRLPVDVMYGLPTDAEGRSAGEYVQHMRGDLERVFEVVRKKAGREQRRQKAWRDRKAYGPVYEPGDKVWMQLPTKIKLGAYWDGPYQNTYRVERMGSGRNRLVVPFDRLKPYHGPQLGEGAQGRQRERRKTRQPAWLRDFIHDAGVSTGRAHNKEGSTVTNQQVDDDCSIPDYRSIFGLEDQWRSTVESVETWRVDWCSVFGRESVWL
ncbi:Retrovirus-related Pol polyprotein from transposon [Trichinella papuae]|uniref:Retrovirus-related Pol polyprotein from transposon n=1 Tax=Trichinella papuae TaxID=268474 RepID=A0A0V1MEZ0_9BILA|nr:Retrovirus-related Pol polyprotein from transposon [Trichinella papuae]